MERAPIFHRPSRACTLAGGAIPVAGAPVQTRPPWGWFCALRSGPDGRGRAVKARPRVTDDICKFLDSTNLLSRIMVSTLSRVKPRAHLLTPSLRMRSKCNLIGWHVLSKGTLRPYMPTIVHQAIPGCLQRASPVVSGGTCNIVDLRGNPTRALHGDLSIQPLYDPASPAAFFQTSKYVGHSDLPILGGQNAHALSSF